MSYPSSAIHARNLPRYTARVVEAYLAIPSGRGRTTMLLLLKRCAGALPDDGFVLRALRGLVPMRVCSSVERVQLRPEQKALLEAYRAIPNATERERIIDFIRNWEMEGMQLNEPLT